MSFWNWIECRARIRRQSRKWITAIRHEEALASVFHSVAEVDQWEGAHFKEDEARNRALAAKKQYEDALREKFFGF
jgi:hypothetical protein